jgi:thiol-disulfide isomerase/thioredoxin
MTLAPPRNKPTARRASSTTIVVAVVAIVLVILAVVLGISLGSSRSPAESAHGSGSSSGAAKHGRAKLVTVGLVSVNDARVSVPVSGKPVTVVEFFAVWCPYCAYDAKWVMPDFARKVEKAGGRIFAVDASPYLGQAVPGPLGQPDLGKEGSHTTPPANEEVSLSLQAIAHYEATFHLPFPLYYDLNQAYAQAVGLQAFPSFLFYNSKGKPVVGLPGVQTEAQLWQAYQQAAKK